MDSGVPPGPGPREDRRRRHRNCGAIVARSGPVPRARAAHRALIGNHAPGLRRNIHIVEDRRLLTRLHRLFESADERRRSERVRRVGRVPALGRVVRRIEFDRGSRIAHIRLFGQRPRAALIVASTAVG